MLQCSLSDNRVGSSYLINFYTDSFYALILTKSRPLEASSNEANNRAALAITTVYLGEISTLKVGQAELLG